MRRQLEVFGLATLFIAVGFMRPASAADGPEPKRMVLVELYTSQGCDMCPAAEKILGALAEKNKRIVPIAFHVDYFNKPWKDVFSDPIYSNRQMTYHNLYKKPKNPDYGLYYTPMVMVDGEQSVNGREPASAEAAIRNALARPPAVRLDVSIDPKNAGLTGATSIKVTSRSSRVEKTPLLLAAVLREDGVSTAVASGENGGKTLVARFPARQTKYKIIELDGKTPTTERFAFTLDPSWNKSKLRVAVFVQDQKTGFVHQAADIPWMSMPAKNP